MSAGVRLTSSVEALAAAIGDRLDGSPCVILLDVDGTLAPIVSRPDEATVPADTRQVLERLADLPNVTLGLVSGRAADDAARVAGMAGVWVIGNHGFEWRAPGGTVMPDESGRRFEGAVASAAGALKELETSMPGVLLEDKHWTISVHYRLLAPERVGELARAVRGVAERCGLALRDGKKVIELRPPVEVNKGTSCVALAERCGVENAAGAVLYAGDDSTDEDAFRALRRRWPGSVTIRVAADDSSPASEAEFAVASPAALRDLLRWTAERRVSAA